MKKLSKFIITLILLTSMVFSMTGCINSDWADVEQKLVKNGYEVDVAVGKTELTVVWAELTLIGLKADLDDIECVMAAEKGEMEILIIFCDDRDVAKSLETQIETRKSAFMRELDLTESTCDYGRDGEVVYIGHKQAVKDAK